MADWTVIFTNPCTLLTICWCALCFGGVLNKLADERIASSAAKAIPRDKD